MTTPHESGPGPSQPVDYPPPPYPTAPAQAAPAQAGPFRQGFGLGAGLGLGLLATTVAVSLVAGVATLAGLAAALSTVSGTATEGTTTIWGSETSGSRLRALEINGPILTSEAEGGLLVAGVYGYEIAEQLDRLTADDAGGVVLLVNTPGGSITGSRAISDAIVRYRERTGQKVFVHVEGMSASGGVYSTAPADEIFADHGSIVGSIGVIFGPISRYRDVVAIGGTLLESGVTTTGGITQEYITAGTGKDVGNPFRDLTAGERAMLQAITDDEYDRFVDQVATHRGIEKSVIVDELGAGIFSAAQAERIGLVDGTLGRDEFFREAARQSGLDPDQTRVEALREPSTFESLLGMRRSLGSSPALSRAAVSEGMLSPAICGATTPLVFAGDLAAVCG